MSRTSDQDAAQEAAPTCGRTGTNSLFFRAVFLSVMFTSFLCMMPCVAMGNVGMMPRLFMSSTLMMLGGFTMVVSRMLMMFSG